MSCSIRIDSVVGSTLDANGRPQTISVSGVASDCNVIRVSAAGLTAQSVPLRADRVIDKSRPY